MSVRILPHPAGVHSRRGPDAVADTVRHALLRIFVGPLDPDDDHDLGPVERGMTQRQVRRREWHAIGCAVGDLVENLASLFAVAVVGLGVAVAGAAVAIYAPVWMSLPALAVVMLGCAWRLRVASQRVDTTLAEVAPVDSDVLEQLPVVNAMQDKENGQ